MCLVTILNQQKLHGGNIYLSIQLIIQLEINPCIGAIHFMEIFTSTKNVVDEERGECTNSMCLMNMAFMPDYCKGVVWI